jgi:uncharacterized membrane protein
MKRLALLVPALLALTACQPRAPDAKPAAPPAAEPPPRGIDISQPITARGNEPFWSVTIDGTHVRLTRPDQPEVAAETAGAVIQPGRATWVAMAPGQQITITVYESPCSDGMSDTRYPLTAEVALINESLRGCAARTADLRKPAAGA